MEYQKLIEERYSVRRFKNIKLKKEDVEQIIKAGHLAPTGCNYQPYRVLVINSEEAIQKLKACTKCHFNAPNAMLVCYNKNESWVRPYDGALSAPVDSAIVATHMMLKAHEIGVGCCWVMHFNPESMRNSFNIPEGIEPSALLVMGYPKEDSKPLNLHSEFRALEDIVFYDSF